MPVATEERDDVQSEKPDTSWTVEQIVEYILARAGPRIEQIIDKELDRMSQQLPTSEVEEAASSEKLHHEVSQQLAEGVDGPRCAFPGRRFRPDASKL